MMKMPELSKIYQGDVVEVLKTWPDNFVDTIITSPPYWSLRDYGVEGQIGMEHTLGEFLDRLLAVTEELKRVLKPTGVMFWNMGDCYSASGGAGNQYKKWQSKERNEGFKKYKGKKPEQSGVPAKCLVGQNYRLILKMVETQGWIWRNTIVWHKPNAMPSSVKDRFSNSYEPVFMLVKNKKYWFDLDAVRVPHKYLEADNKRGDFNKPSNVKDKSKQVGKQRGGRQRSDDYHAGGKNPGDVWKVSTNPFPEAHFATFPPKLIEPMIKSGCPENGIVLDPFMGSGTTALVARNLLRNWVGIELSEEYIKIANERLKQKHLGI